MWLLLVALDTVWLSGRRIDDQVNNEAASALREARYTAQIVDRLFVEIASFARILGRQVAVQELLNRHARDTQALTA